MPSSTPSLRCLLLGLLCSSVVQADTVVLKNGKQLEDVVVSRDDDEGVVINPWGARQPEMTWEIPEKNFIPRAEVAEVLIQDPPRVEYNRRIAAREIGADEHIALAADPGNAEAAEEYAVSKFSRWAKGNPPALSVRRALRRRRGCGGGHGPAGVASKELPIYVYHGTDDHIVGVGSDRSSARSFASGKRPHDFVYAELDGVGHGFPASVRNEIFGILCDAFAAIGDAEAALPVLERELLEAD